MLSLSSAIDSGKFEEFIQQAEAKGIGAIDMKGFDSTLSVWLSLYQVVRPYTLIHRYNKYTFRPLYKQLKPHKWL